MDYNIRDRLSEMDDFFYQKWLIRTGLYKRNGVWERIGSSIHISGLELLTNKSDEENIRVMGTDVNDNYKEVKVNGNILIRLMNNVSVRIKDPNEESKDIKYIVI